jgi:transposase-like protein
MLPLRPLFLIQIVARFSSRLSRYMVVRINGRRMYLWRAIDDEGEVLEVLEVLIQSRRNKAAAQ